MGTDIHAFAERRTAAGWELIECDAPFFGEADRCYSLFAVLAGVRDYSRTIRPVAADRGIPADLSPGGRRMLIDRARHFRKTVAEFCRNDLDHHSHSWVLLSELRDYDWNSHPTAAGVRSLVFEKTLPTLSRFASPEDVRIVFWFDC